MSTAALIYPHQLFDPHPAALGADVVFMVEDPLLFRQYAFHKQKLILHRATMKRYVREVYPQARYVDAHQLEQTGDIVALVKTAKCNAVWPRPRLFTSTPRDNNNPAISACGLPNAV